MTRPSKWSPGLVTAVFIGSVLVAAATGTASSPSSAPAAAMRARVVNSKSRAQVLVPTPAGRAPSETPVALHLAINHDSEAKRQLLEETVFAVSDPDSPRVGQYLSAADVAPLVAPSDEARARVDKWLSDTGLGGSDATKVEWSPWGNHLFVHTTVGAAEAATGLTVSAHEHTSPRTDLAGRHMLAASDSRLPAGHALEDVVGLVRVAGSVDSRLVAQGQDHASADVGAAEPPPLYPYQVWPPPTILNAGAGDATTVGVQTIMTCPYPDLWPSQTYPFISQYAVDNLPAFSAETPCGDEYGGIVSYELEVTDPTGATQSVTVPFSDVSVSESTYRVVGGCSGDRCYVREMTIPQGQFAASGFNLELDVPYTVKVVVTFEGGSAGPATVEWTGLPEPRQITIVTSQPKMPSVLQTMYSIPASPVACEENNRQSIGVLQGVISGYYSPSDLSSFYSAAGIATTNTKQVNFVTGGGTNSSLAAYLQNHHFVLNQDPVENQPNEPGLETSLDIQYITGMAPGAKTDMLHGGYFLTFDAQYSEYVEIDAMQTVFLAIQYAQDPPLVLSMSYGMVEPPMQTVNAMYRPSLMAFATMGITVIASSGDTGAYQGNALTSAQDTCQTTSASYPATSPYVTAVGATQMHKMTQGGVTKTVEVAASIETGCGITSGGGFSTQFAMPSYQADAVAAYFNSPHTNLPSGYKNKRAMPDVAVSGNFFRIWYSGSSTEVDGTSASAPSFAGMVTLWNDQLLREKRAPLGFLNPKLYKAWGQDQSVFNDIVDGSNACLGQDSPGICCLFGFSAVPGYDAISGLGSPRFDKLGQALLNATWSKGSCTVAQMACRLDCTSTCDAAGHCGFYMAPWAIALIVIGVLALCIVAVCVFRCCNRKRKPAMMLPVDREVYRDAGGAYVTMSPAVAPKSAYVEDW